LADATLTAWATPSAPDSDTLYVLGASAGVSATGWGESDTVGSTGLTVMDTDAVPALLAIETVAGPSAAPLSAARLKVICVGVTASAEIDRPVPETLTRALVNPLPSICTARVSPRRIDAGEEALTAGACAPPPVITCSRLPAAS
jgi:hypothetical protein